MSLRTLFSFLGLIIVSALMFLVFRELKPQKQPVPNVIELPRKNERPELSRPKPNQEVAADDQANTSSTTQLLFDRVIVFPDVRYPEIFGYDPQSKKVVAYHLIDKTYRELYASSNITDLKFSPSGLKLAVEKTVGGQARWYELDLTKDKIYSLNRLTRDVSWFENDTRVDYWSNGSTINGFVITKNNQLGEFIPVAVFSPTFSLIKNELWVTSDHNAPIIAINILTNERRQVLPPYSTLDFLANQNYVFISAASNSWTSTLSSHNKTGAWRLPWGTLSKKCTLTNLLVCGVPKNQSWADLPESWFLYQRVFSDRLIIADPGLQSEKEVPLVGSFDIVNPVLSPLGIIFLNRTDARLYLVPMENSLLN